MHPIRAVAVALSVALATPVQAQSTQRIRGDVVSLDGAKLTVRTRTGELASIKLPDPYKVTAVVRTTPEAIVQGSFVGTASMPQPDGTGRALEVLVFPESGAAPARATTPGTFVREA
jgi:hypothetical protein